MRVQPVLRSLDHKIGAVAPGVRARRERGSSTVRQEPLAYPISMSTGPKSLTRIRRAHHFAEQSRQPLQRFQYNAKRILIDSTANDDPRLADTQLD